jgi:protein-S-isoprenylcysteine O-methyltransferase Ste14
MVEYAVLVAASSLTVLGSFARSAELWFSRLNWELVGYAVLALVALRFAAWAFKPRH